MDTEEYYGGKYPDPPHEIIDCDLEDEDYDGWYADYMHDRRILGDD